MQRGLHVIFYELNKKWRNTSYELQSLTFAKKRIHRFFGNYFCNGNKPNKEKQKPKRIAELNLVREVLHCVFNSKSVQPNTSTKY